ncbi:MFS transporter [Xenorhabdus kozodoii]|uniref:Membrane protein n=1 Tax=Xenorhabdus kozodoii TaxID=351676 RepID=A0A2D0LEW3_9GAMM|nr:MFS transporter [Xenorhabdus kozodoii]PHM74246.1 membrane protein [Xenorhabdus kozodoii]
MKHKSFYLYQAADVIFTSSCRAIGMLLSWVMIEIYALKVELGWFISLSWLVQVSTLIVLGLFSERVSKNIIPVFCSITSFMCLIILNIDGTTEPLKLGSIYIITSLLCIAIQPIGASIIPDLYKSDSIERAFRIRGFVNSINTVLGAAISGVVIKSFSADQTVLILTVSVGISVAMFLSIKTNKVAIKEVGYSSSAAITALLGNKVERMLVIVSTLSNFILTPTLMYITPILVVEKYKFSALTIGLSEATFGIGMFIGSIVVCGKLNYILGVRVATACSISLVGFSLLIILIINNVASLYVGLFFAGLGVVIYNINTTKIRCSATPPSIRGSFESIFLAICILPIPVGIALSTLMVESGNLEWSLALFSLVIFASAIAVFISKDFQKMARLDDIELNNYYIKLYPKAYHPNS